MDKKKNMRISLGMGILNGDFRVPKGSDIGKKIKNPKGSDSVRASGEQGALSAGDQKNYKGMKSGKIKNIDAAMNPGKEGELENIKKRTKKTEAYIKAMKSMTGK